MATGPGGWGACFFAALIVAMSTCGLQTAAANRLNEDADTLRGITLQEITVKKTRNHYSKRNNPAVDFQQKIREARDLGDPRLRHPYYNYRKYDRMSLGINDFVMPADTAADYTPGKWDFIREHVDTSDITGLPILPLSVKEKITEVVSRRSPKTEKQLVTAISQHGIDEIADLKNMEIMVEDVFREVDLYDNDINLMSNRFVSPLSPLAPDFYRFFLSDTVLIDNRPCIVLSFAPRNPATFGFLGRLYVEQGDTTMFVRRVKMGVSPTVNLNFVDRLTIVQEFDKAADGSRLKRLDDMLVEFTILKEAPGIYARRTTAYDNHTFDIPDHADLFDQLGTVFYTPEAYAMGVEWWDEQRPVAISTNEKRMPQLLERLRNIKFYRYAEKFLKWIVQGYISTGNPSKFDFGPLNTTISANSVEGLRLRLGGMTTANLSNRFFARGYGAYGFRDHKFVYSGELEYSFRPKEYHPREFPINSIRLNHTYDINQIAQDYMFTNADNVFIALKRTDNHLINYRRQTELKYTLELANNFTIEASANLTRQEAGPWMPFVTTSGDVLKGFNELLFDVQLRYAPGEKFYQMKSSRVPINKDAPVIVLRQTYAPRGVLGSRYNINKTELSVQKRFWFSAFGFTDVIIKGGHVWSRAPFIYLPSPNVNLSYTIQPESFALLNPLEFIASSYGMWDITYWANGAILNYIPYIKKLKFREVVSFRGWLGRLDAKCDPRKSLSIADAPQLLKLPEGALAAPMHSHPYIEVSVGLDNIFKILRLDYVWRLSYRNHPGVDRSGLRVALHFTF